MNKQGHTWGLEQLRCPKSSPVAGGDPGMLCMLCMLCRTRHSPTHLECRGTYRDGGQRQRQLADPQSRARNGARLGEEVDQCDTLGRCGEYRESVWGRWGEGVFRSSELRRDGIRLRREVHKCDAPRMFEEYMFEEDPQHRVRSISAQSPSPP